MNMYLNKYILIPLMLLFIQVQAKNISDPELKYIRNCFYAGIENEEYLDSLDIYISKLLNNKIKNDYALLIAYRGAGKSLRAVHTFWPLSKLNFVKEGLVDLNSAVNKGPDDVEIRFLRFSVLDNLPGFLGYGPDADSDAKDLFYLLSSKPQQQNDLISDVAEYLIKSERLSQAENQKLKKSFGF